MLQRWGVDRTVVDDGLAESERMAHLYFGLQLAGIDEEKAHAARAIRLEQHSRLIRRNGVVAHIVRGIRRAQRRNRRGRSGTCGRNGVQRLVRSIRNA